MPAYQLYLGALNCRTTYDRIREFDIADFGPDRDLADTVRQLPDLEGLAAPLQLQREVAEVIASMPPSISNTIREVMRGAIERRVAVTFAWRPGYDFKVEVTESLDSSSTRGGITVLLESRYPDDRRPQGDSSG
jgi:hypothetical protein